MGRFFNLNLPFFPRRSAPVLLAFVWFLGLVLGAVFSAAASDSLVPLMRIAVESDVSFTGLLAAILLPFLLSAFAVYIREPWLLFLIAFGKAFVFSFLGFGLMGAYGSAGWLVRLLLMFSDCGCLPLLFWFWLRHLPKESSLSVPVAGMVLMASLLIGCFDYCIVSPFLAALIS